MRLLLVLIKDSWRGERGEGGGEGGGGEREGRGRERGRGAFINNALNLRVGTHGSMWRKEAW